MTGSSESYLVRVSRPAMACEFEICLRAGQYPHGTETALAALDLVEQLEGQLSVFRGQSELARINATAAQGAVEVEPRLFALLELACGCARRRAGPMTSRPARSGRRGASPAAPAPFPHPSDWPKPARTSAASSSSSTPGGGRSASAQPGVQLNLGSIGKGFAVDRCGEKLLEAGIDDFLVQGGNSSVLAHGADHRRRRRRRGSARVIGRWAFATPCTSTGG